MIYTSLQGYIEATYDELISVFGEPTHVPMDEGDGKIATIWEFGGYNLVGEEIPITIYDWKDFDNGEKARSGLPYEWHIGGTEFCAVSIVTQRLDEYRNRFDY